MAPCVSLQFWCGVAWRVDKRRPVPPATQLQNSFGLTNDECNSGAALGFEKLEDMLRELIQERRPFVFAPSTTDANAAANNMT